MTASGKLRLTLPANSWDLPMLLNLAQLGIWGKVVADGVYLNGNLLPSTFTPSSLPLSLSPISSYPTLSLFSSVPIWLDDVDCLSNDTTLLFCQNGGIGVEDCRHINDVAVKCNDGALSLSMALQFTYCACVCDVCVCNVA